MRTHKTNNSFISIVSFICMGIILAGAAILPLEAKQSEIVIPLQTERLSKRVLLVKSGTVEKNQIIAIATQKGIVVIDTGGSAVIMAKIRKLIEKEFGRKDFLYLINTHYHSDHTGGNQIFAGIDIISHSTTPALLRDFAANRQEYVKRRIGRLPNLMKRIKGLDPKSREAQGARELYYNLRNMYNELETSYRLTLPTITFKDRMTLDLGDITLRMIYFGKGRHTGDDIIIHCPEEKLLFTGDLFSKNFFYISFRPTFEAPRWMEALDWVAKDLREVKWVVNCHSQRMTGEYLAIWRKYLGDVWTGLSKAHKKGLSLEAVKKQFAYSKGFAYLEKTGLPVKKLKDGHPGNLQMTWSCLLKQKSAAETMKTIIQKQGIQKAVTEFKRMTTTDKKKYFFRENEFNNLGYLFLGKKQYSEAIEVLKMNTQLNPKSWNAFDSLGEACKDAGKNAQAIKYYEKSIQLNPENDVAKKIIEGLKKKIK